MAVFSLTDPFLKAASQLEKGIANKLIKAVLLFYRNPKHPSLNYEKLHGQAAAMYSIRVDQGYRAILQGATGVTVFHFVGTHDDAYRFADRAIPVITARLAGPRPA
jgi:hypothetical protein